MTNDEIRMTKEFPMTKSEDVPRFGIGASLFFSHSVLLIRHFLTAAG